MKTFVINLPEAHQRREKISATLHGSGLDVEFFPAIRGIDGEGYFSGTNAFVCIAETSRLPTPNEYGCYASHLQLWKYCVDAAESIVILEDDVSLSTRWNPGIAAALPSLTDKFGFIRLEPDESHMHLLRPDNDTVAICSERIGDVGIFPQYHPHLRTSGYSISPRTAAAFIAASGEFACPVDHFLRRVWRHRQALFAAKPSLIELDELAAVSGIPDRTKQGNWLRRRYIRMARHIYRQWARQRTAQMDRHFRRESPHLFARAA